MDRQERDVSQAVRSDWADSEDSNETRDAACTPIHSAFGSSLMNRP